MRNNDVVSSVVRKQGGALTELPWQSSLLASFHLFSKLDGLSDTVIKVKKID
jgi:hypothetical protein